MKICAIIGTNKTTGEKEIAFAPMDKKKDQNYAPLVGKRKVYLEEIFSLMKNNTYIQFQFGENISKLELVEFSDSKVLEIKNLIETEAPEVQKNISTELLRDLFKESLKKRDFPIRKCGMCRYQQALKLYKDKIYIDNGCFCISSSSSSIHDYIHFKIEFNIATKEYLDEFFRDELEDIEKFIQEGCE